MANYLAFESMTEGLENKVKIVIIKKYIKLLKKIKIIKKKKKKKKKK